VTRRIRNILIAIATAATLAVAGLAAPALASKNVNDVRTGDANPGGKAFFKKTSRPGIFRLGACDIQKDSHGVQAYASFNRWGMQNEIADLDGANGKCKERWISIKPSNDNRTVYVTVCLHKKGNRFCEYKTGRS
jgi:hypothetical protein